VLKNERHPTRHARFRKALLVSVRELRELVNAIIYVLSAGCQSRYVPKDLPRRGTLHGYLERWNLGRHADAYSSCPHRAVIDLQSMKSAEKEACIDRVGYDASEKIKGRG
jgi:hypothetical protein